MIKHLKNLCFVATLIVSGPALAESSGWSISEVDGQVSVIRDGKPMYGATGTQLEVGDVVRTSEAGRAVLSRGDKYFIITPKSQVRIKPVKAQSTIAQMFEYLGDKLLGPNNQSGQNTNGKKQVLAAVVKGYGDEPKEVDTRALDGAMNSLNPSD